MLAPELPTSRRRLVAGVKLFVWLDPEVYARVVELESECCTVKSVVRIPGRCDPRLDLSCHLVERDHSRVVVEECVDCGSRRLFGCSERRPFLGRSIVGKEFPPCHLWLPSVLVAITRWLQGRTESKPLIVRRLCQLDMTQVLQRPVQEAKDGVIIRPNVAAVWITWARNAPLDLSNVSGIRNTGVSLSGTLGGSIQRGRGGDKP